MSDLKISFPSLPVELANAFDKLADESRRNMHFVGSFDPADFADLVTAADKGAYFQFLQAGTINYGAGVLGTVVLGDYAICIKSFTEGEVPTASNFGFIFSGTVLPHASSHENGNADELDVTDLGGYPGGSTRFLREDGGFELPPGGPIAHSATTGQTVDDHHNEDHASRHNSGGADELSHDALADFSVTEHRVINDGGNSTTELWSASKIDMELSTIIAGLDIKPGVDTSTTGEGNITLSGEQTLNGLLTSTSSVIVTEQTAPEDNGFYVTAAGAWSRAAHSDEDAEVTNGNITHVVNSGSTKFKYKYLLVTGDPITVGTTGQIWEEHRNIEFGTIGGTATEGNDSRVPTQDENDAMVGTSGAPSTANKYVTNTDSRNSDARAPTAHTHVEADITDLSKVSALTFGGGNVQASGTVDRFLTPWFDAGSVGNNEIFIEDWPFAATLDQLRATWGASTGSESVDFDLRINGVNTALDFTALSDAGLGSNLVDSVVVAAGDQVSFLVKKSASTGTAMSSLSVSIRVVGD